MNATPPTPSEKTEDRILQQDYLCRKKTEKFLGRDSLLIQLKPPEIKAFGHKIIMGEWKLWKKNPFVLDSSALRTQ